MEASTVESAAANGDGPNDEAADEAAERSPAESRDASRMFEYAEFVHVGPGAETCADGDNGKCSNTLHFHAWIRLPNPFQRSSIAEKAQAAKARRKRIMQDPESDMRTIIEDGIAAMVATGDRDSMVDEIVNKDFLQDHLKAMREVAEDEDYEHIEEDQERYRALNAKEPEERDEEEYDHLQKHISSYTEKCNTKREEMQAPLRESLAEKSVEELADLVRNDRIERAGQAAFNDTYNVWEWYVGTLKPRPADKGLPNERVFSSVEHLRNCAPEVYEALDEAFTRLEAAQGGQLKNS